MVLQSECKSDRLRDEFRDSKQADLEAEVIQQEGQTTEEDFWRVDGHAASSPALGSNQIGIVWQPGMGHQWTVWIHHHLP